MRQTTLQLPLVHALAVFVLAYTVHFIILNVPFIIRAIMGNESASALGFSIHEGPNE